MVTKYFAAFLVSSALLSGTALAQTSTTPMTAPSASALTSSGDHWRAMKFSGLDVYNDKDEKIGDVSELMIDKDGKIGQVVISVGGFLGMGQHEVAVKFSDLKFMTEPRRPAVAAAPTTGATGGTTGASGPSAGMTPAAASRPAEPKNYPEYAVLANATKDSLKAMPAFKY